MKKFDAIIIGSGQGGAPLAKALAKAKWKTALIEKKFAGGTCINYGCTPTKTIISCAKTAYNVKHAKEWGINAAKHEVDIRTIMKFKNRVVNESRNGLHNSLTSTPHLTYIEGAAKFTGFKELSVELSKGGIMQLKAEKIFIDAGASPAIPAIEGLDEIKYYTSQSLLDLKEIPESLIIIGGSYIALEFGQTYSRFGSKVTILERSKDFLPKEDRDIALCIQQILETENIHIHTGVDVSGVKKSGRKISVAFTENNKTSSLSATHLLIATGRKPNTKPLDLEITNVATDERGFIKVNDKLETSANGIYAIGDVTGEPQFTHISYNDYVILKDNLLNGKNNSTQNRQVPYCMFTDPQLARTGISETEARKQKLHYKVATLSMKHVARARETNHTKGMMKAVVDADTKQILGAAIIGEEAGETIAALQMAMLGKITYTQLAEMVIAHPTYAESINNLFLPLIK
ncbi:mercuric reductase [Parafilimonas terrae]|uniref:Pyruvate/2-oxoglutarate dehydrogenase complex, dihydrolipoamide dehydrogenase (E3) component n=1 Tax=Parafilimonas terrae TaxID=1465490 RepID=A0A1I5ZE23_9BACT|nr:mercuric reductase [Parafilimonas terrae]SFQ54648.1 Pyruvate/2-oxoglutarate dehydrogenase complex, dihydrolipoamide dehydrogenase (E3) component [Parafilimonas terrae]